MGGFKDKLSAISPFGILIGAFSAGFTIASLMWLLLHSYPTHDKINEYEIKINSLKYDIELKQNDNIQLQAIIKKNESELSSYKNLLNSKTNENDQLKSKISKLETENKQLIKQKVDKPIINIPVIEPKEKKNIEDDKKDAGLVRNPEPIFETWQQQRRKTGFTISVIDHGTTDILEGSFFITLNRKSKSGIDATIRARGYRDMKIDNGQVGQDFIFRCVKNYEIRILDIGLNSNVANFFIREIE